MSTKEKRTKFSLGKILTKEQGGSSMRTKRMIVAVLAAMFIAVLFTTPLYAQSVETYIVQPGDTMLKIADRFDISVSRLAAANGVRWDSWVYSGQRLVVPSRLPDPSPALDAVEGWAGRIVALPFGSQHRCYFERTDGEGFGIGSIDDLVGQSIEEMRKSGEQFLVWGNLRTDVPSYAGRYIDVEYVKSIGPVPSPEAEEVEGWVGRVVTLPFGSQHRYYFERVDGEGFGIGSIDDLVGQSIEEMRRSGEQFLVWGKLRTDVPSYAGRYIDVDAIKPNLPPSPADDAVERWEGRIVNLPSGSQHAYYFERSDGEGFSIGSIDDNVASRIEELRWTGQCFRAWGTLRTDVPSYTGRYIEVVYLEVASAPSDDGRNLTSLAKVSGSSALRTDRWGQYYPWMAVDGQRTTSWSEGVQGPGVGEWIMLTFSETVEVQSVRLSTGYDKSADIFLKNNRIKKATLLFSNGEQVELGFADKQGMQAIPVIGASGTAVDTTFVKLIIQEVFPGWKYDDTCLAEIEVWGATL